MPVTLHTPELYISLPERAELTRRRRAGGTRAHPRAAAGVGPIDRRRAVDGRDLLRAVEVRGGTSTLFDMPDAARGGSGATDPVARPIVLTEGFSMPARSRRSSGAAPSRRSTSIPGQNIHEGICTSIWGAPTAESHRRASRRRRSSASTIPMAKRSIADVQRGAGPGRRCKTWLREGWMRCLLPVVEIRGQDDPDEFLLVHGHYDSWYEGIGDNATGDAALLELARVLVGPARPAEAQRADRLVARPLDRPLCRIDLVRRHVRRRDRRVLHRAARHRLAGLRRRDRLRRSDVDGRGRTRCAASSIRDALGLPSQRRAAASRRRLLVQPDRSDRPLHAAVEHPDRGAAARAATTPSAAAAATSPGTRRTT